MSGFRRYLIIALVISWLVVGFFLFSMTIKSITNVSAVEANGVGVYWNYYRTREVDSIDWGNLTPGSTKSIVVYVRNEVQEPVYLFMMTKNWKPPEALAYLTLRWNYDLQKIDPYRTLRVTLTLSISSNVRGISTFDFDIVITGNDKLPGDVDGDGDVDVGDQRKLQNALFSVLGDTNWNPDADFDNDGDVDIGDQKIQQNQIFVYT